MKERLETALRMRTEGATFRAIGMALSVGAQRARTIVLEAQRKKEWEKRHDAAKVLQAWASSVRSWGAFRKQVAAIDLLFPRIDLDAGLNCPCGKDPDDCAIHADAQG